MKALCKLKPEPGISMAEIPIPEINSQEVLIKIKKTAICGTDMHIYHWDEWARATIPVPMAVGHEFMGEVIAIGKEVKGIALGERVSGEGHLTCGQCHNCQIGQRHLCPLTVGVGVNRQGAFAEYLAIPANNVFKLPDHISDDVAAILDPLGNATHTALAFNLVSEDVLITGAGPIGIMATAIAKKAGARSVVITDVNAYRLKLAKKMGADIALNVTEDNLADVVSQLGLKEGFTVGLEMSGHPLAFKEMLSALAHGGKVALLGIQPPLSTMDWNDVIFKCLTLKGIYGREIFRTWYQMSGLLQAGLNIAPIITHHFSVDDYQRAFEVMGSGESGKVILNWE